VACGRRGPLRGSAGPGGELGRARVGEGGSVRAGPSAKEVGRGRGEAGPRREGARGFAEPRAREWLGKKRKWPWAASGIGGLTGLGCQQGLG